MAAPTSRSNGGRTWSTHDNQPTAQFYRVALDNDFPYHVYGAQQDNSTVRIASAQRRGRHRRARLVRRRRRRKRLDRARSASDSQIVYAGSYDGLLTRYDHRTGQLRNVNGVARQSHGLRRGSHEVSLPVETIPSLFSPHDPKHALRRRRTCVQNDQRRAELGGHQPAT